MSKAQMPSLWLRTNRFKEIAQYARKLYIAIFLILLSVGSGIIGYIVIEGYTASEALYMTIITLSTVGFSEVQTLSETGRMFTTFLIIFNIGVFAYAISIISTFIVEGEFKKLYKDYRVFQKIKQLREHIIVCGFGRHGNEVVNELLEYGKAFVVLENDAEKIATLRNEQMLFIQGDATQDSVLEEAGIRHAKSIIVTLEDVTENLYVVLSARQFNPTINIITRCPNREVEQKLLRAGANHVVMPERLGGRYMARMVSKPDIIEFFDFLAHIQQVLFEEISCSQLKEKYQNRSFQSVNIRKITGVNVIALRQGDKYLINPTGDTILNPDMDIIIVGDAAQIERFRTILLKPNK